MDVEAVEKSGGRRDAFFLVIQRADAAVDQRGRRGLAEVVRHGAEHDDQLIGVVEIVDAPPRLVDHHQRMHPHVAFRMPLGFLLAPDERLQLRKQLIDDAKLERERESDRRPRGAQQQLFELSPDALRRQIVESDRAAQRLRVLVERQLEARGKLQRSQHAKTVVGKRRPVDDAQNLAARDRRRPLNGSSYVSVSGSHEIALMVKSRRRAASSIDIAGSPSTTKPLCPRPAFDSRRGKSDVDCADLVDGKALTDRFDPAERLEQARELGGGNAEDLHVECP